MVIQWFPGHMAKSKRLLVENLKLIDVVIELLDARIPRSSKNPDLDDILNSKPRIIALNKSDLADEHISKTWVDYFNSNNIKTIFIDSIKGKGIIEIKSAVRQLMSDKIQKQREKGRIFIPIRTMVVGIPNVGKSSFINNIAGKKVAATGDKPGVTRGKQWIRLNEEIELLDTPGILWPKFEDNEVGLNLAFTGAIKDDVFDRVEVCMLLLERLSNLYPDKLIERYKLQSIESKTGIQLLNEIGKKRGAIISGGEVDLYRISSIILDEFRGGKIGKITLEFP